MYRRARVQPLLEPLVQAPDVAEALCDKSRPGHAARTISPVDAAQSHRGARGAIAAVRDKLLVTLLFVQQFGVAWLMSKSWPWSPAWIKWTRWVQPPSSVRRCVC